MSGDDGFSALPSDLDSVAAVFSAQHDVVEAALQKHEPTAKAVRPDTFGRTIESADFWSSYRNLHEATVSSMNSFSEALHETSERLRTTAENFRQARQADAGSARSIG